MKIEKVDYSAFVSKSWDLFTRKWPYFIIFGILGFILQGAVGSFDQLVTKVEVSGDASDWMLYGLVTFVGWILSTMISVGFMRGLLGYVRGKEPEMSMIFEGYKPLSVWINSIFAAVLTGIVVTIGLILFILPGIYFLFKFIFAPYIVIDKELGPIDAMKKSWEYTTGNFAHVIVFGLISILFCILGIITLGLGFIVITPLLTIVYALFYKNVADFHELQDGVDSHLATPSASSENDSSSL